MSQQQIDKLVVLGVASADAAILASNDLGLPKAIKLVSQQDLEDLEITSQNAAAIKALFPSAE